MQDLTPGRRVYYPALQGLRAIAALLVFTQHYLSAMQSPVAWLVNYCWVGVDLFFVLSGFLITGNLYDGRDAPNRLQRFYWHRAMRIYPLFYGVLLLVFVAGLLLRTHWQPVQLLYPLNLGNYARFFLHPPNSLGLDIILPANLHSRYLRALYISPLWSLCVEEQFYFIWPFIVFGLRDRRKLLQVCLAIILLEPLVRYLGIHLLPRDWTQDFVIYFSLPFRCDALAFGALLALLRRGPEWEVLLRWRRPLLCLGAVAMMLPAVLQKVHGLNPIPLRTSSSASLGYSLIDFGAATLVVGLTVPHSRLSRLFSLPWMVALGTISYGFYIFHQIPRDYYQLAAQFLLPHHPWLGTYVVGLTCTTLLAMASWRFYESPFLRFKNLYDVRPAPVRSQEIRAEPPVTL